jgi:hypothetical protein
MSRIPQDPQNPSSPQGAGSNKIDDAIDISIIVFMAIALYNALELAVLIPLSFRRYRSLYFWSLFTSTILGVVPSSIGGVLQYFDLQPLSASIVVQNFGWIMMVPNQSVVLYSRLHLVSQNTTILRIVRWLIVLSLVVIVVPTIVLNAGWSYMPDSPGWSHGYFAMERIQVSWFTAQECFISGVYIWNTAQLIRLNPTEDSKRHKILYELLAVNIIVIIMDLALVILQYLNYYFTQVIFKATVYSVKLKLEFAVLGMLVSIVHRRHSDEMFWRGDPMTV